MDAWLVRGRGAPWEVFERAELPAPTPERLADYAVGLDGLHVRAEGEAPCRDFALVRVAAAALAWPDVTMATGEYPVPISRPYVSGQEAVGVVEYATPSLQRFVGKRVVAFTPQPFGSFAEVCVAIAPTIFDAPPAMSDEEAAAFLIASHTAYHAVHRRGCVQAGETALVLGAAGGVPSAAVQLCVAAGARVVAVAGGPEKVDFCRKLGAHVAIDHRAGDFAAAVTRAIGPNAVDLIVDFVQGEPGRRARPLLRVEGRHVMAGHAGGLLPVHPKEFYLQNWTLVGCCMGSGYGEKLPEIEQQAHDHLLRLVAEGKYRPSVGRVVAFDELPAALRAFADRRAFGRTVVRVGRSPEQP
jgi:NADPH2:quinone reductase